MPASTPIFGIPYPCAGENIDCDIFGDWADAIQTAVDQVRVVERQALNRPSAQARGLAQLAGAANTPLNLVYQTELYDNDNMISLGTDASAVTIRTAGWYLFSVEASCTQTALTQTSQSIALSQNGTVAYRRKLSQPTYPALTLSFQVIGLFNCAVSDVIRAVHIYTGSPAPTISSANINGYLVSQA